MTALDALSAAVRDRLLAGAPAHLPELGTFERAHVPARVAEQPDGSRALLPPGETVRFVNGAQGDRSLAGDLARHLARHLGPDAARDADPDASFSPDALDHALDALLGLVAARGEVHLRGVGLLRRGERALAFAPERLLTAEINEAYGGLAPVALDAPPPPETPDAPAPPAHAPPLQEAEPDVRSEAEPAPEMLAEDPAEGPQDEAIPQEATSPSAARWEDEPPHLAGGASDGSSDDRSSDDRSDETSPQPDVEAPGETTGASPDPSLPFASPEAPPEASPPPAPDVEPAAPLPETEGEGVRKGEAALYAEAAPAEEPPPPLPPFAFEDEPLADEPAALPEVSTPLYVEADEPAALPQPVLAEPSPSYPAEPTEGPEQPAQADGPEQDLDAWIAGAGAPPAPVLPPDAAPEPAARPQPAPAAPVWAAPPEPARRSPLGLYAALAGAALLLAGLVFALNRPPPPQQPAPAAAPAAVVLPEDDLPAESADSPAPLDPALSEAEPPVEELPLAQAMPEPPRPAPRPPPAPTPAPRPAPRAAAPAGPADVSGLPEADAAALTGDAPIEAGGPGFTWVLNSTPSQADAERQAARYRQGGFRTRVLPATAAGRTVYRVAVGQFATREHALRLRSRLPTDAPPDAWTLGLGTD